MLICKNCNKEYTQTLKFCPSCGSELIEKVEGTPADNAGAPSAAVSTQVESAPKGESIKSVTNDKACRNCGAIVMEGEKFCIKCGTPVKTESAPVKAEPTPVRAEPAPIKAEPTPVSKDEVKASDTQLNTWKDRLQADLSNAFHSNSFFNFFWKYAIVFALYYPIYLLMARIRGLYDLVEILDYVSIFGFYAYYIGLIALWSKKNYMPILIAFAIRLLNSFILLFQTEVPISSICRIAVLVTAFVFVFKDFKTTGQYQNIRNGFEVKPCPDCGASVKTNDKFCPKCGRKMEE